MLTTFILAILAAAVLYRLYTVLGMRGDSDAPRQKEMQALLKTLTAQAEKVSSLKKKKGARGAVVEVMPGAELTVGALETMWPDFDEGRFLGGAKKAFEKILAAYHARDLSAVSDLLTPSVRKAFESAQGENAKGEHTVATLVSVSEVDIQKITVIEDLCRIDVLFVSEQRIQTQDAAGRPVADAPEYVAEVQDIWVFEKSMTSQKTAWLLTATRNAA